MAKKSFRKPTPRKESQNIIVNQIQVRSADRNRKDIGDWKSAVRSATSAQRENRIKLYDLYVNILQDAFLKGVINTRMLTVTNTSLKFVMDEKEDAAIAKLSQKPAFKRLLKAILNSKLQGYTVGQIEYHPDTNNIEFYDVPKKHIRPKEGEIVKEQSNDSGFSYREPPYTNFVFECGEIDDLGLLLEATPLILYKRGSLGDWAQFSELFGMPIRKATYNQHDPTAKAEAQQMLEEMGSSLSVLLPEGVDLDIIQNTHQFGGGVIYDNFVDRCNRELSILILGQTETTQSSESSGYAQAAVHQETKDDIAEDDRSFVLSVLNDQVLPLLQAQGLKVTGQFEWEMDEHMPIKDKLNIDLEIKKAGIPIADDHFYETYDIPKPDNYDELKKASKEKPDPSEEEPSEEEESETTTTKKGNTKSKQAQKKKLSRLQRLSLKISDFFDLAPKS